MSIDGLKPLSALAAIPGLAHPLPSMLCVEEKVKDALASLSPAQAARSEDFERGTLGDCRQLLPVTYRVSSRTSDPRKASTRALQKDTVPGSALYFAKRGLQPSRDLLAIADDLSNAKNLPAAVYETLWDSTDSSYGTESFQGLRRLVQDCETAERIQPVFDDIARLEDIIAKSTCTLRLNLLILSHAVEWTAPKLSKEELAPGVGRKTVAIEKIVAHCDGFEPARIRRLVKRHRNYL
ncbi:hypothetical protein EJ04DRAFT_591383 [Polyplosphaeria fusca]|uniref:Uncharacterized protein n=1 Tax=Polyplosphaeria fusca TaxID=682080 RepID=A0A9P4QP65_9PLEO|nr:hypothetical protein EJ04DRAFT_591383 [Polyplosphaeria fusca]